MAWGFEPLRRACEAKAERGKSGDPRPVLPVQSIKTNAQLKLSQEPMLLPSRIRIRSHHRSHVIHAERSSRLRIRILHRDKARRRLRGIVAALIRFDVLGQPPYRSFGLVSNDIRPGIDSGRESVASGWKSQKEILVRALLEPRVEEVASEHFANDHSTVRNAVDRPATRAASARLRRIHRAE